MKGGEEEDETIHDWKRKELAKWWCTLSMSNDVNKAYTMSWMTSEERNQPGHFCPA